MLGLHFFCALCFMFDDLVCCGLRGDVIFCAATVLCDVFGYDGYFGAVCDRSLIRFPSLYSGYYS